MTKTEYERLLESVRQGGAILRGEVAASRTFEFPASGGRKLERRLAICVRTDDPDLLIVNKIYQVNLLDHDLIRVIDEEGEAAIYPADHFLYVSFPPKVERVLSHLAKS